MDTLGKGKFVRFSEEEEKQIQHYVDAKMFDNFSQAVRFFVRYGIKLDVERRMK